MRVCPYCAEEIQDLARKCKHCGEWLDVETSGNFSPEAEAEPVSGAGAPPRKTSRGLLIGALLLVVVLVLGGLAFAVMRRDSRENDGDPLPSREAFTVDATIACAAMFNELAALPEPQSVAEISEDQESRRDIYQRAVIQLRALEPQPADRAAVEEWLDAIEGVVPMHQSASHAAFSDDLDAFTQAVDDIAAQIAVARTKGGILGIDCP